MTSTTDSPTARRWTVRAGTDGAGTDLFEVYAPTMEEARASVERTAVEVGAWAPRILPLLLLAGFTVHAGDVSRPAPLGDNPWVRTIPAPDYVAVPELVSATA